MLNPTSYLKFDFKTRDIKNYMISPISSIIPTKLSIIYISNNYRYIALRKFSFYV